MTDVRPYRTSRRDALKLGGVSLGVLAALDCQSGLAIGDDVPPAVRAFLEGWQALDPDQITLTFAADGQREDVTSPVVFHGHDEIRRSLAGFFSAFENAAVRHPAILAGPAPYAADTWVFTGAYVGALPGFPAGSGELLTIRGFTLIELAGDEIQRTTDYYDAAGILDQIDGTFIAPSDGDSSTE